MSLNKENGCQAEIYFSFPQRETLKAPIEVNVCVTCVKCPIIETSFTVKGRSYMDISSKGKKEARNYIKAHCERLDTFDF